MTIPDDDQESGLGRFGWLRWPLLVAFWTLPALLLASQMHFMFAEEGRDISWGHLLGWQIVGWYFWVPVTPIVIWFGRRVPSPRHRRWLFVVGQLGLALLAAVLHVVFLAATTKWLGPAPYSEWPFVAMLVGWLSQRLHLDLLTYGGLLGIGFGLDAYRKYRERELQASRLEAQLAQAQLQALKMQLHPHFLFNTLHAISVLVRKGSNQEAVRMLAVLSDLLRMTLDDQGAQEVSLKQELEFLERYLELEQIRFQDRLQVQLDIAPETLDARIPNLILQPLVENAIRHGIARAVAGGQVHVRACRERGRLRVEVRDDGPGLAGDESGRMEGVGLSNTRERLERLYGAEHRFSVGNGEHGGAVAIVEIPFVPAHD